jgi:hypothetical protein
LNDTVITPAPLSTLARAQAVEKLDRQFLLNYLDTVQKEKEIMMAENRKVNTLQIELAIVTNELDVVKREKQSLNDKFNFLRKGYDRCVNERGQIKFDFDSAVQKIGSLQKDLLAMKKENQSLKAIGKMSPSCDPNFDLKIPSELCYKIHVETLNKDNMLLKKENQSLKDMLRSTANSISNEENNLARLRQNIDKTLQEEASPNNSLESIMTSSGQSGLESPTESGQNRTVTSLISSPNSASAISLATPIATPTSMPQSQEITTKSPNAMPLISSPNSASAISRVASESRQNIDDSFLYPKDTWCNEKMLDNTVTKDCLATPTSMPQSQEITIKSPNAIPNAMPTSMPQSLEITTQSRIAMPIDTPIAEPSATPIAMPTSMPQSQKITTQNPNAMPTATPIVILQPKSITPKNSKILCKNLLVSILKEASSNHSNLAPTIQQLVEDLIYGRMEPEIFTKDIPFFNNLNPSSALITTFLKRSLPYLRESLKSGEISINEFTLANVKNSHQPAATTTVPGPRFLMSSMQNGKSIFIIINFPNDTQWPK